jgi:hypothetical protein
MEERKNWIFLSKFIASYVCLSFLAREGIWITELFFHRPNSKASGHGRTLRTGY